MAKVLLTWELGGGSGHFVNLRPFVCGLEAAGHKVFAALRDLGKGPDLLGGNAVTFLQAPYKADVPRNVIPLARTFADILHNVGFGDAAELAVRVDAWRDLIDSVAPDLIIFDHSPTALLAARGGKARRVLLGDSFCCPPDCAPFPDLRPWLPRRSTGLFQTEKSVLENVNRVLRSRGQPALARLGQLYGEVDDGHPDHPGGIRPLSRPRRRPLSRSLDAGGRGTAGLARRQRQEGLRLPEALSRPAAVVRPLGPSGLPDDCPHRRHDGGVRAAACPVITSDAACDPSCSL